MKKILTSGAILLSITVIALFIFHPYFSTTAEQDYPFDGSEPDLPAFIKNKGNKEEFMLRRAEGIALKRGIDKNKPLPDPKIRQKAIAKMERQQEDLAKMPESSEKSSLTMTWTPIGPAPIPNGQVAGPNPTAVSGRVTAIAVHPTNPNIVYVGTAQGGLYRTTNGGTNWTPMMDNALSLAIGAVAIAPSQPETVYVGTGEGTFAGLSFFGVGIYRIDNASSASPVITGPLNRLGSNANNDIFTGRSISKIVVHPNNPATIFVSSQSGVGGIGQFATQGAPLPNMGIYRSFTATSSNPNSPPSFQHIGPVCYEPLICGPEPDVHDFVIDPLNPNRLIASSQAGGNAAGLYLSTNALDPFNSTTAPGFTRTLTLPAGGFAQINAELAIQRTSGQPNPVVYAATGSAGGTVFISSDGGSTWTQRIDNDFCSPQCGYNIAIAVDPNNASRVYLGGAPTSTNFPNALTFGISTNSAASFTRSENGLHADTHVIAVAPSQPSTIYIGTDGGISKSTDSGATWTSLNNSQFSATQFMSIAVHPTDVNFTIGGTQDNGTNFYQPQGAWTRADQGDGGYAVIDQNATDTTNVRMYHTYFNQTAPGNPIVLGYGTVANTASARDNGWTFRGCLNNVAGNGISCSDTAVNFYAPLARGPGNPNTIYYGTDRLYRSADAGVTHAVVSPTPITANVPISAIGISPQNDNVRIVGQNNGGIWGTTTGTPPPPAQPTLRNLDPGNTVPNHYIARAVIDPNNQNTAYVTLSAFGVINIWKTTNLNAASPTWTPIGIGSTASERIPVNAFLVDPANSNTLYAGTDIGVYISTNGGAAWTPFGTGLPRIAVFDMAITSDRKLRIATHGRGMWEISLSNEAPQPRISINDVSKNEGNSGTTAFTFTVSLSTASSQTVTVNFTTANGSATAGSDYIAGSGTLTFNPNETSKQVTVQVNGDTTVEPDEDFNVNLSNPTNAIISDGQGKGTIVNDDVTISINDVSQNEGNSGTTAFNFNVTLSAASNQTITVNFATADGTATVLGNDYNANSGTVTFNPNETVKQITVQVRGDTAIEPNETFFVNLSGATNAAIADNQGVGTILNDDSTLPSISINDISMNEGNSGTTAFTFTVNLTPASSQAVTVNYSTADGTAVALSDYIAVPANTLLTFGAGETSKQVAVSVIGDTMFEPNETFTVNLSNPSNAVISDNQGVGTIVNDDGCNYSINPTSQNFPMSGGSGTVQVTAPAGCAWTAVSNNSFTDYLSSARNQDTTNENNNFIASLTEKVNELFSANSPSAVFSNTALITIPDSGTASPYPSNITVSGMTGTITDLNVKINNLSHTFPDDIALLLVSPDGSKKFILQSDSGGGADVANLTYTFDDQAANGIPDDGPMPANNASVRPSSVGDDDGMPPPAPALPYNQPASAGTATLNGTFGGINPNGTWSLFVVDFFQGDAGSISSGWSLDITTQGASNFITVTSGQNGSGNGAVNYSVGQNTTGQPRSGTMTIAGQTFTVNQSNMQTRRRFDFDGDGKADLGVFRPANGAWYLLNSQTGFTGVGFGISTDRIVPADYDGDGRADIAVFRDGAWYLLRSQLGFTGVGFGIGEDIPMPGDYDGDGRDDIAVFRPANGAWYLLQSSSGFVGVGFGQNGDKPVAADFDGDGRDDIAVFRGGIWYLLRSQQGFTAVQFGEGADKPVAADYDGDGKADIAVFRPANGAWYLLQSAAGFVGVGFGIATDLPVMADFDGDGKADIAVFRDGNWYLLRSQQSFTGVQFGIPTDKPVSGAFVP